MPRAASSQTSGALGEASIGPLAARASSGPYGIFNFKQTHWSAVDPQTGYLYVANEGYGRITIYDPARSSVIGFLEGISGPMVIDSVRGEIVVLQGDGMAFANRTTGEIVATIPGLAPEGWRRPVLVLDPMDGLVYAAYNFQTSERIWLASTIVVVSVRLHAAVAQISGLWFTHGMTYDPVHRKVYVTNVIGGMIAIDPVANAVVGAVSGLDGPNEVAYDPDDGNLYVPSSNGRYVNEGGTVRLVCTAAVAIVDPRAMRLVGNITGFHAGCDGPSYAVYNPDDRTLYVANDTAIVAVDPGTRSFRWEISGLNGPGPLTYDPVGHHLYAAHGDGILDLDPAARQLRSIGYEYAAPSAVAYDSSRNRIYAANLLSTSLVVIDGFTDRIVGRLEGFEGSDSVTYVPPSDELFVGNERNSTLSIFDLGTNRTLGTIPGVLPWAVQYEGRSGDLFVATDTGMAVVSTQTNAIFANVTAYGSLMPLAVDSVQGRVFARTRSNGTSSDPGLLVAINTQDLDVLWNVNVTGLGITSLAFDPLNGNLYAGTWVSGVAVIGSSTGNVLSTIPGPWLPSAALFDPANGYVYVGDRSNSGVLWVIDASTNRIIQEIPLPDQPQSMAYSSANREIYLALGFGRSPGLVAAVPSLEYPAPSPPVVPGIAAIAGGAVVLLTAWLLLRRRRTHQKEGSK